MIYNEWDEDKNALAYTNSTLISGVQALRDRHRNTTASLNTGAALASHQGQGTMGWFFLMIGVKDKEVSFNV